MLRIFAEEGSSISIGDMTLKIENISQPNFTTASFNLHITLSGPNIPECKQFILPMGHSRELPYRCYMIFKGATSLTTRDGTQKVLAKLLFEAPKSLRIKGNWKNNEPEDYSKFTDDGLIKHGEGRELDAYTKELLRRFAP